MFSGGGEPLPVTSYGYHPPPDATAHGWKCPECGMMEDEQPVRRWPVWCPDPECGVSTNPVFDEPWAHEAKGAELQWLLQNPPDYGSSFHRDLWEVWQLEDTLLREDRVETAQARSRIRAYTTERSSEEAWAPGYVYFSSVAYWIALGDLDSAAGDLCHWLSISRTDDVEDNNTNRTNCRQAIDSAARFLETPDGAGHPMAAEIRKGCLRLAEAAYPVLNQDQKAAVTNMARG